MRKKLVVLMLVVSVFTVGAYAATFIGIGAGKYLNLEEYGVDSSTSLVDWIEGRITMGSGLTFDLGVVLNPVDLNPAHQVQFLTYLNLDIPISNFEIYAGFSPFLDIEMGQFQTELLKSEGIIHAGLAINLQKIRIYAEAVKFLYYSPFNLLPYTAIAGGIQIGF